MDIVAQGFLTGKLLPRVGASVLAKSGLAINAIGFAFVACLIFVPRVEFLLVSIMIFTLGDGLFQPSVNAIISNAASAGAQSLVQSANQSQQALARMLGPLLAAVLSPLSLSAPYRAGGVDCGCRRCAAFGLGAITSTGAELAHKNGPFRFADTALDSAQLSAGLI